MLTLGCARNEVDSEELVGRLDSQGWQLVDAEDDPDVVVVNTCGFVESAKKESVDTVLAAADSGAKVVAVGCMAQRYGSELAEALPEADAVLGFDHYPELGHRLDEIVDGQSVASHQPTDRRKLLPLTPVQRPSTADDVAIPGHGWGPRVLRKRLDDAPVAALKLASGCDRRCSFCAIPSFRGSFVSRPRDEVLAEAAWLAENGVKELFLVSENSTSYGKDFSDQAALEKLLPELAAVDGIERVRVSYLQPAETRPGLLRAIATESAVASYFDLSFQHSSTSVLRRMRRFGSTEAFLDLIGRIRELDPRAGIRSNVIVGFPGETDEDFAELERFVSQAEMDVVGVFGYSDEEGTEAATLDGKLDEHEISRRVSRMSSLVDELSTQRAQDRIGDEVHVLLERAVEDSDAVGGEVRCDTANRPLIGRAVHQGPDVDGECVLLDPEGVNIGDIVRGRVISAEGVDLMVHQVPR